MKTIFNTLFALGILLMIAGCEKENTNTGNVPQLKTLDISEITDSTVMSGGLISTDRGSAVTARGVCWNTQPSPKLSNLKTSDGNGTGKFLSKIDGLQPNTTYYIRAYATNSNGTEYGNEISFKTTDLVANSFTDMRDGNFYRTVSIGNQVWMAENLKYLPDVHNNSLFMTLGEFAQPAYGVIDYNDINLAEAKTHPYYLLYGTIYNWYAIMNDSGTNSPNPPHIRGVCPVGWHVPTDMEWKVLEMALGMSQAEADNINWRGDFVGSKLAGDNNLWYMGSLKNNSFFGSSGFNALPGGCRYFDGSLSYTSFHTNFWTATEYSGQSSFSRKISANEIKVFRNSERKQNGYYVRCVKD